MNDDIMTIIYPGQNKNTFLYSERIEAMKDVCSRYNIKFRMMSDEDAASKPEMLSDPFVLTTSSLEWYKIINDYFSGYRKISNEETDFIPGFSYVVHDTDGFISNLFNYLNAAGRKKVAFFSFDRNSVYAKPHLDVIFKVCDAIGFNISYNDIYWIDISLDECFAIFKRNVNKYDAVFCTNDQSAVFLCKELRKLGIGVPDDLYVIGRGNSSIGRMSTPAITTSGFNETEIGKQTVFLFRYLKKHPEVMKSKVVIEQKLIVRESTANFIAPEVNREGVLPCLGHFLREKGYREIQLFNEMLNECDENDIKILEGIKYGAKNSEIADAIFMSDSTVKYKIAKMTRKAGVSSREQLSALLKRYGFKV